jgi:hypothetical protein
MALGKRRGGQTQLCQRVTIMWPSGHAVRRCRVGAGALFRAMSNLTRVELTSSRFRPPND